MNHSEEIYKDSEEIRGPREARGGAFAPADIPLIKKALLSYVQTLDTDNDEVNKVAALVHRLGRIT